MVEEVPAADMGDVAAVTAPGWDEGVGLTLASSPFLSGTGWIDGDSVLPEFRESVDDSDGHYTLGGLAWTIFAR